MSILAKRLQERKSEGRKGLIIYVTAGYPNITTTLETILAAEEAGADIVEIGIPFSDPIADGPTIQKAATEALKKGISTGQTLELIHSLRRKSAIPLAVMTYVNTVLNYGPESFAADFSAAGVNGTIVPDLPLEESALLQETCRSHGIDVIQFVAPTSTSMRITDICKNAAGFLYCISTTGVTGIRKLDYATLTPTIEAAREATDIPIAIGFGIGSPEAAREAARYADAVIVGSAVIEQLTNGGVDAVRELVQAIRQGLDKECG